MQLKKQNLFNGLVLAVLASAFFVGGAGKAHAGIIPYSVIAPHEYQLPVGDDIPKDGIDLWLSYNTWRDEGKAWDGDSASRSLFVSVNKFVHIFKFDALPKNTGFLWEAVVGFGNAQTKDDQNFTGMIDGQMGLVAWHKPAKNWVNCLEYWLYLPIGDNELSGHSWNHSFAYMTNYTLGNFTFDGDVGYKITGDAKANGAHVEQGNTFFANAVFAYKFMKQVEPFFKLDFQNTESGKVVASSNPNILLGNFSSNDELAYGIGNQFYLSDKLSLALWYEGGLTGRNNVKTNAAYARAIWTF